MRALIVAGIVALVASVGATIALSDAEDVVASGPFGAHEWTLAQARGFTEFPLYWAGTSFDGMRLMHIDRVDAAPYPDEPVRSDFVSFSYGQCQTTAADASSCGFPLQIQVWRACARNPAAYDLAPGIPMPYERTTIRGIPAFLYSPELPRLELTTGKATIVLFGARDTIVAAAQTLRGVTVPVTATEDLPEPAAGALEGRLQCPNASTDGT